MSATGESFAAWRISSEYAFPIPEKSVGSVSARFSVWFSLSRRAENASSVASSGSRPPGSSAASASSPATSLIHARFFGLASVRRSVPESKSSERRPIFFGMGAPALSPLEAARDHEVEDEEEIVFEREDEALPEPGHR